MEIEKTYREFEEKVERTVYIDNLSPLVTTAVVKTALDQFGTVLTVHFLPNYYNHDALNNNIPLIALVQMGNHKEANAVIAEMTNYPFMINGMPRPVRAFPAQPHMFVDRPVKPNRKIQCKWMDPKDHDFQVAQRLKTLTKKHRAEAQMMLKFQLEKEEELHKQQSEVLKSNYKKYDLMDKLRTDGTIYKLGNKFGLNVRDD
ncbi:hypothetical protein ACHQM5_030651 [Ranunculus cassubicifolius]